MGIWDTSALNNKGMSHVSAYQFNLQFIPEPGTAVLLGIGALGFVGRRRSRVR